MPTPILTVNLSETNPEQGLVKSFSSDAAVDSQIIVRGDQRDFRIHFVERETNPAFDRPFKFVDPSGWEVTAAAGSKDEPVTGGTFMLNDPNNAEDTSAIAWNATAGTVQTRMRADMPTLFSAAVVTGSDGGPYTIEIGTGTFSGDDPEGLADALTPNGSSVVVEKTQTGDTGVTTKWLVTLVRGAALQRNSPWNSLPAAAVATTVTQVGSATANKVVTVTWNDDSYDGAVWLSVTGKTGGAETVGPIPFDATPEQFEEVVAGHSVISSTDNVTVAQNGPGDYSVTFIGTQGLSTTPAIATSANTLKVPVGLQARLIQNTAVIIAELGAADSVELPFEIEIDRGDGAETVVQSLCTLNRDLIRNNPGSPPIADHWARRSRVPYFLPGIIDFSGGSSDALGSIDITLYPNGQRVWMLSSGCIYEYIIAEPVSAPTESVPFYIDPVVPDGERFWLLTAKYDGSHVVHGANSHYFRKGYLMPTAAVEYGIGASMLTDTTQTGNVGTGEDTLQSFTLPAGILDTDGQSIRITVSGSAANNGNTKALKVKFGATTMLSVTLGTGAALEWIGEIQIFRTGAATQKAIARIHTSNTLASGAVVQRTSPAETLTGAITILVTGEATTTNDIVKEVFKAVLEQ